MRRYKLDLYFRGPLLFKEAGTIAVGIDSAMQTYRGKPVLNGSLLRGNIRHALRQLLVFADKAEDLADTFNEWFGNASGEGMDDDSANLDPKRSLVQFDLFWKLVAPIDPVPGVRTRILIDDNGNVASGALQTMEDVFQFRAEEEPVFCGYIGIDESVDESFVFWLERALCYIPAMGSDKAIGFGKLDNFIVTKQPAPAIAPLNLSSSTERFGFSFSLDRPLCLGGPRTNDGNHIVSSEVITGNVIKAVIANACSDDSSESDQNALENKLCFDQLIVNHCLPAPADSPGRMPPLPHSVAYIDKKNGENCEIICATNIDQHQQWLYEPSFKADRSQYQELACRKNLGLSVQEQMRIVLVRTGIESTTGTSKEGELFSIECVVPETRVYTDEGESEFTTRWCGNIDLRGIPAERRPTVTTNLQALLAKGLKNIGKTKASTYDFQLHDEPFSTPQQNPIETGQLAVVTTMSDSRLFVPGWERRANSAQLGAWEHYKEYWKTESDGHLRLDRIFASQILRGGVHHHWRFQKNTPYCPEWLTTAGSVFVVKVLDDRGKELLESWQQCGLPASRDGTGKPSDWHTCPYLPEHGFGEILVNWTAQRALMPSQELVNG